MNLPLPMPLFGSDESKTLGQQEEEAKELGFESLEKYKMAAKLFRTWALYGKLVQDETMWKILNEPREEAAEMFCLQSNLVYAVNELAHILKDVESVLRDLRS